jgi:hypothetical protein
LEQFLAKKNEIQKESYRQLMNYTCLKLQEQNFVFLTDVARQWNNTQTRFHTTRFCCLIGEIISDVEIRKFSKKFGIVLFCKTVDYQAQYLSFSNKPIIQQLTTSQIDFFFLFLSSSAKIVVKALLLAHLGPSFVRDVYGWKAASICSRMQQYEENFRTNLFTYLEKHNPTGRTPDSLWCQISRLAQNSAKSGKRRGGRVPWELKEPSAAAIICEKIQNLDSYIPANLETPSHYVSGISLSQLEKLLKEEKEKGTITIAPKAPTIWKAFLGKNKRGNIPVRLLNTLKCIGKKHPHQEMLRKFHQLQRDILFSQLLNNCLPPHSFLIIGIDDLAMIELDILIFNQKKWSIKQRLAPSTDFIKGNRLIFSSHLFLTPHTVDNMKRKQKLLPPLPRFKVENLPTYRRFISVT